MYRIIIGFSFVAIYITVFINGTYIDLFPDFVGYMLIYSGIKKIQYCKSDKIWAESIMKVLMLISLGQYVMGVLGLGNYFLSYTYGLIIYVVIEFIRVTMFGYLIYMFVETIEHLEDTYEANFYGSRLNVVCKALILAQGLCFLCMFAGAYVPYIVTPMTVLNAIIFMVYIIQLFISFRRVDAYNKKYQYYKI